MKNKSVLASLALGLASLPCAALAVPITYDFTVNGGPDGPLAGVISSGFFSFDDSIIPAGGGNLSATTLFTDLEFTWNGIAYDETTAESGALGFDASGALSGWLFGSNCNPGTCFILPGFDRWAVLSTAAFGNVFAYTLADSDAVFTIPFAVTVTPRAVTVPEPSTLALFGLAALMLPGLRRQRPRSA
jgi:hypothetical protein